MAIFFMYFLFGDWIFLLNKYILQMLSGMANYQSGSQMHSLSQWIQYSRQKLFKVKYNTNNNKTIMKINSNWAVAKW